FRRLYLCNDPPPHEHYLLPLHDALPIWVGAYAVRQIVSQYGRHDAGCAVGGRGHFSAASRVFFVDRHGVYAQPVADGMWLLQSRSEEHTSELQSRETIVCRCLLEKKTDA